MAYKIIDTCTACGLCEDQCPVSAIAPGEPTYVIDETCCDFEECLVVCPVDAIVPLGDDAPDMLSAGYSQDGVFHSSQNA